MAKAHCRYPLSSQHLNSLEAHGVSLIQTPGIELWYFPLDVFILRITSDINNVPHLSLALSPVSTHHTLLLCFHYPSAHTHIL